jgi:hypothetical protein
MEIISVLVGLALTGAGFLVKAFPNVISGYSTLPAWRKKQFDIAGLSTFIRNGLWVAGLSLIGGYYLFTWLGFTMIADLMIVFVLAIGVAVLTVGAQRFDS